MPDQDAYTGETILDPNGKKGQAAAQPQQPPQPAATGPTTRLDETVPPQTGLPPVSKQVPLPQPFRPPTQPARPVAPVAAPARPITQARSRRPFLPLFGSWLWTGLLLMILLWILAFGRIWQSRLRNAQVRPTPQIILATPTQALLPTSTLIPTSTPAPQNSVSTEPTVTLIPQDQIRETTTIHGVDPSYLDRGNYFYSDKGIFGAYLFSGPTVEFVNGATKGYVLLSNGDQVGILDVPSENGMVKIVVVSNKLDPHDSYVIGSKGWVPAWIITGTNVPTPVAQASGGGLTSGIFKRPDDGTHGHCTDDKNPYQSSVWGVVVDQDGLAWPGVPVHIISKAGPGATPYDIEIYTDSEGRFNTGNTLACGWWKIVYEGHTYINYDFVSGGPYDGYGARVVVRY